MAPPSPLALVLDERYLLHRMPQGHPERPERLGAIYAMIRDEGWGNRSVILPPRAARPGEIEPIHPSSYVAAVEEVARRGGGFLDADTYVSPASYDVALLAAGGLLEGVDAVLGGKVRVVFALVRPPGHHAEASRAMGFCLFNNVAVAARYAQVRHGVKRVLVVDWDLHHGNGTQHAFEGDRSVLYFSTHQYPYYPGTGALEDSGSGGGVGYTVNIPFPAGQGNAEYAAAFERVLLPIGRAFRPEIIFVSAGFDTYVDDPLGGMKVTESGFALQMSRVLDLERRGGGVPVVLALEGGYDLRGLQGSVRAVIETALGKEPPSSGREAVRPEAERVLREAIDHQTRWWPTLKARNGR